MNPEEISAQVIQNGKDISGIKEKLASAHKRIDENDRIAEGIHKLASNVESLTLQIKFLAESLESNVERLEKGLKAQGERIGALEKEPAAKWKALVAQVTGIVVAALIGGLIAKFMV